MALTAPSTPVRSACTPSETPVVVSSTAKRSTNWPLTRKNSPPIQKPLEAVAIP